MGAGVRRAEGDERVHAGVAAEALHVVARDEAAQRVAHDVHALVAGLLAGALHEVLEAGGRAPHVVREGAVVEREHPAEAGAPQAAAQQGEDRAVVDQPVHQDDRRAGGDDVAEDQPALHGRQVAEGEAGEVLAAGAAAALGGDAEGVRGDVRGDPGHLGGGAADAGRAAQQPGAALRRPQAAREGGAVQRVLLAEPGLGCRDRTAAPAPGATSVTSREGHVSRAEGSTTGRSGHPAAPPGPARAGGRGARGRRRAPRPPRRRRRGRAGRAG